MGKALPCEIGVLRLQGGAHHSSQMLHSASPIRVWGSKKARHQISDGPFLDQLLRPNYLALISEGYQLRRDELLHLNLVGQME